MSVRLCLVWRSIPALWRLGPSICRGRAGKRCQKGICKRFMEASRYASRYTCDARSWRAGLRILYMPSLRRTVRLARRPERLGWTRMPVGVQQLFVYLSQPLVSVCWSFEETRSRPEGVVVEEWNDSIPCISFSLILLRWPTHFLDAHRSSR